MTDKNFYEDKFKYYSKLQFFTVITACLSNIFYISSDFDIYGGFNISTLLCRLVPICLVPLYVIFFKFTSIKPAIKHFVSFMMFHILHISTVVSCYYLQRTDHVAEGNITFILVIFTLGITSSYRTTILSLAAFWATFIASTAFIQYQELSVTIVNMIPVSIGILVILLPLNRTYRKQYEYRKQVDFLAYHDFLTKLYSRNALTRFCLPNTSYLQNQNCSIAIIDIDDFKKINDTRGHQCGDICLINLADTITKNITDDDIAIRWGGEEFILAIDNKRSCYEVCETIRKEIAEKTDFTISIGIYPYDGSELESSVMHADEAMYYSKRNGKNQTVEYSSLAQYNN